MYPLFWFNVCKATISHFFARKAMQAEFLPSTEKKLFLNSLCVVNDISKIEYTTSHFADIVLCD